MPAVLDGGWRDCSILSNTSALVLLSNALMAHHIFPTTKGIYFLWIWVACICVLSITTMQQIGEWDPVLNELVKGTALEGKHYYSYQEAAWNASALVFCVLWSINRSHMIEKSRRKKFVNDIRQREASQRLFRVIEGMVPVHVVGPMIKNIDSVIAEPVRCASILFIMIVDFDTFASSRSPDGLLKFLNNCFKRIDAILQSYEVTKIETVGEEYVAAVGVIPEDVHLSEKFGHSCILGRIAAAATDIFALDYQGVEFKMGMHTGAVVAGVIGHKLPRFRLFGDTINTAARMMQKGVPGQLQFGEETRSHLPNEVSASFRGEVEMKGKGMVNTYFLDLPKREPRKADHRRLSLASSGFEVASVAAAERGGHSRRSRRFTTSAMDLQNMPFLQYDHSASAADLSAHCALSDEARQRFEKMQKEIDADFREDTFADVFIGTRLVRMVKRTFIGNRITRTRFNSVGEKKWLQVFHESTIVKKFDSRIEKMLCVVTLYFAYLTWHTVFFHPGIWPSLLFQYFCSLQFFALVILFHWRCVFGTEWFLSQPRSVHRYLCATVCIGCLATFQVHRMLGAVADDNAVLTELPQNCSSSARNAAGVLEDADRLFSTLTMDPFCHARFLDVVDRNFFDQHLESLRFQHPWSFLFFVLFSVITTVHALPTEYACVFFGLPLLYTIIDLIEPFDSAHGTHYSFTGEVHFLLTSFVNVLLAHHAERNSRFRFKAKQLLERTGKRIEDILNTLMPPRVIEELQELPPSAPPPSHVYRGATIAQSDLCGFTKLASTRQPHEVVEFISQIFGLFDDLTDKYEVYKVETVGDAYIAGQAGWPLTQQNSAVSVVHFALDMIRAVHMWSKEHDCDVSCRVGVHTGVCIGGIVGTEMMRYHLFGDLMHVLELLESTSLKGRVQVSIHCQDKVIKEMRQEGKKCSDTLIFEQRREPHLSTSKEDIVRYDEVGGRTFLVRRAGAAISS
eukprot:TRINITY_DN27864_c0_g1_i1.p1 TRINITY_DN27864_c0_g1~~TRINITY_DN27864_c0_g1_i1.p1  ORF type:complete len:1112 (+),score=146.09 TRINITY_DN27864_c0_g1_i1:444-3338(+)